MPINSAWRSARLRQPRSINWMMNAITSASTPAMISDATSVPGVHAGLFPSRAVTLPRNRVAVTVAGSVIVS